MLSTPAMAGATQKPAQRRRSAPHNPPTVLYSCTQFYVSSSPVAEGEGPPLTRIPQPPYTTSKLPIPRLSTIQVTFQWAGWPYLGVRVSDLLNARNSEERKRGAPARIIGAGVDIVGGSDYVLEGVIDKQVSIYIMWPGYTNMNYQRRIKTGGQPLEREVLLAHLAEFVETFVDWVKKRKVIIEPGYERWAVGPGGIRAQDVIITALVHREGTIWQPELYLVN